MTKQWMTIIEYARRHNISDMTVRRRIKTGKIKAVLKEGKYFIQQFANTQPVQKNRLIRSENNNIKQHYDAHSFTRDTQRQVESYERQKRSAIESYKNNSTTKDSEFYPLRDSVLKHKYAEIDSRQFVDFCESSLKKISELEKNIEFKYQKQLECLNVEIKFLKEKISSRDLKLSDLTQKIEDLETLLQFMENTKLT